MRILDRLVGVTFLRLFVVSILATPPLFILGDLTEQLSNYIDQGLTSMEVAHGYLYNVPEYVVWSFPIAGLIAAVFTVHGMTQHREIVAAKAGGVSFHRLILPILVLGAVLTGLALSVTDLVPLSKRKAGDILEQRATRRISRPAFTYQTEEGLLLSAQRLEVTTGQMSTVGLHRPPSMGDSTAMHVDAESAVHDTLGWRLEIGTMRRIWPDGGESTLRFQSFRYPGITERPEDLMEEPREEEEMTYAELERQARIVERAGGNADGLRVKREQKLAIPVATFVIILFGAPLATSSKRGGTAFGVGISLGSTLFYILLLKVSGALGSAGAIPPEWAAWAPNVLFAVAGLVLLARVRT